MGGEFIKTVAASSQSLQYANIGGSYSLGNGTSDSKLTIFLDVVFTDKAFGGLLGTGSAATTGGWYLLADTQFRMVDQSATAYIGRAATTAVVAGERINFAATYDGSAVTGGIHLLRNGINVDGTTSSSGVYVASEPTTVDFYLGARGSLYGSCSFYYGCGYKRVLSTDELLWLNAEPYAFLQPPQPYRKYFAPTVEGAIAGSASITQSPNTLSSVGEVAIVGTASLTQAANTLGATATSDIAGSASITQASGAVSASGTVDITGTVAITQASGTVTSAGTVDIAGTASLTQSPNTLSAEGASGLTASATLTQFPNTLSSTGIVAVVGAGSLTQSPNTLSSTGAVEIAGTANLTQSPDTVSAVASGGTVGDAAIVQANGGMSAAGSVAIIGVASLTQTGTISAAGTVLLSAAANLTQSPNTISATGFSGDQLREIIVGTVMNLNSTRSIASLNPIRSVRPIVPE